FTGSYRYSLSNIVPANKQEDIGGIAPGCQKGVPCSIATPPLQPRFLVAALTGRLTPNLVNEFHFDCLRHLWSWISPCARIPVLPCSVTDTSIILWSVSR